MQFPNAPLLVYLAATAMTRISEGRAHDVGWALSRVALSAWAYEELAHGANWFRRGLGAAVLVGIVAALANDAS